MERVVDRWPVFAHQLKDALLRDNERDLAAQVGDLRVVNGCGCGDDFCQSFYTELPPEETYPYPDRARNVVLPEPGWDGYLILESSTNASPSSRSCRVHRSTDKPRSLSRAIGSGGNAVRGEFGFETLGVRGLESHIALTTYSACADRLASRLRALYEQEATKGQP